MDKINKLRTELVQEMKNYIEKYLNRNLLAKDLTLDEMYDMCLKVKELAGMLPKADQKQEAKSNLQPVKHIKAVKEMKGTHKPEQTQTNSRTFIAYTDGGYSIPKNVGAGAYILLERNKVIDKGGKKLTDATNNIAELTGIYAALQAIVSTGAKMPIVKILSDSQYAIGVVSGNYAAKKNKELIAEIQSYIRTNKMNVTYEWVRGHNGNRYNEDADKLCNLIAGTNL